MNNASTNNFWLLLEIFANRRNLIVGFVLVCTIVATVVAFVLPKWYEARALLLPPKNVSLQMGSVTRLSEIVSVTEGLDLPVMATPTDVYARMLKSRTITNRVMERFSLVERFEARNRDEAYKIFMDRSDYRVTEEGLLEVSFEDKDAEIAADVANALVEELDRLNREIVVSRARENREFIQQRLGQVKAALDSSRSALEAFQTEHRTVDFDEQTRLAVEQAIQLKVQLAEVDLQIGVQEARLAKDNSELIQLRQRRDVIGQQLEQLESENPDSSFFSLPVAAIPRLRGEYEQLYSKVRVNENLYDILLEQFEQAKIQENESQPTLSVLDFAEPPQLRSRPRRAIIVGGTFAGALILILMLAAVLEYVARLRESNPQDYQRAMRFITAFLGWLPGVKKAGR